MADTLIAPVSWRSAQRGLWVASADEHPVGIVTEKWTHGFVVTTRTGRNLGTYRSLDEAQGALEASL